MNIDLTLGTALEEFKGSGRIVIVGGTIPDDDAGRWRLGPPPCRSRAATMASTGSG